MEEDARHEPYPGGITFDRLATAVGAFPLDGPRA